MKNAIPTVAKSMELLLLLSVSGQRFRQSEIARRLDITPSTAYRLLQTLAASGWVAKDSERRWGTAAGLMPLAYALRDEIRVLENCRGILDALAHDRGIHCKINLRGGHEMVHVMDASPLRPYVTLEGNHPLVVGATAGALLCDEPESELLRLVGECEADIPEKHDPQILLDAVDDVRRKGWTYSVSPNRWRVAAIAAPIRSADGAVIAALTFVGLEPDFTPKKIPAITKLLLASAKACASTGARISNPRVGGCD